MARRAVAPLLTEPVAPLLLGGYRLPVPVVLAPMAGITNRAFRRLCREQGAGLYISEMVTSRALLEGNPATLRMCGFDPDEAPRSIQLYGVDPAIVGEAVSKVVAEDLADHVDLNLGCPVPKVTRKGGGAALPWKLDLLEAILTAAVSASRREAERRGIPPPPVTVKMRMGIDADHLTYFDAGLIAADAGVSWVALHARTAAQSYSGQADWSAISRLREVLASRNVPVLGNGDIWTADDAIGMVSATGCAGVVVGRGCLGRPWLFGQLAAAFEGREIPADPGLGHVLVVMRRHAELLCELFGSDKGPRDFRKHVAWYLKGFRVPNYLRVALANVSSLTELDDLLAQIDSDQPSPIAVVAGPRGRTSGGRPVALPQGWLESRTMTDGGLVDLAEAELASSGG